MAKMRASSKEDAMKIARYVGCSGAHQDKKGNWIPCANPEDLVEILDKSARNSTEKLTKKKRRRFVNGQWERLGERGPISIDTIDGGGLVSGMGKSLTEWFKEEWVDISRPKKGGGFEACGRDDADKGKYPKCVPASRASNMSEEEIRSAVSRKRRAESTQSRDGKKPIYVPTDKKNDPFVLDEKSATPTNPELYARVKAEAKKKFDVYPSAYANAWLVREYKKRGGGYRSEKADDGDYEDFVEDLTEMQLSDFIDWVDQKEKAEKVCPPATSDIGLNIKNRQNAINTAGYGPLNPKEPNVDFWEKKAKRWSVTIEESKKQKCGNCAVFIKTPRILECIESGLGNESGDTAWDVINAGDLGYCEAFDFKCASARTCDAWVGGGPVTVEKGKQEEKAFQTIGRGTNSSSSSGDYDRNARDADGDGSVQEGTDFARQASAPPTKPSSSSRSTADGTERAMQNVDWGKYGKLIDRESRKLKPGQQTNWNSGILPNGGIIDENGKYVSPPKELGNIDLSKRKPVKLPSGDTATIRSMSVGTEDGEVLIPTIGPNGEDWDPKTEDGYKKAWNHYVQTGQHLGIFNTPKEATVYGEWLHDREQDRVFGSLGANNNKKEEKADTSTIIIGRAKPRIGDPDVYTDPNSARLRSRKLGCIGIARRETPDGEVVWTPCTNISDQRRYQGETPLGQRDEARRFADRLAEVGGPDRKRRRMRKYKSLEYTTDIKAFRTLGSSMGGRGISGSCREFTGVDGDGDGFVCNPASREDDLPLADTRKIFKRGGKMLSREELVEQDETILNMFGKGESLSKIGKEVDLDPKEVDFLINGFRKNNPKSAFTLFNNRNINIQKKREERRKLVLENVRKATDANRKLNARGEDPTPESDDDLDFTLDPDKVPQYLKKNFAKYMQRLKDPEFADEIKKIADDLRAGLGLAGTAKKYKRDSAFIEIVRRNEKITKTKKLQKNIRESEVPDFNNDTDDPDFTLDPEKIPQFLKRGFAGNVRLARSPEFAEERKKIADDLLLGLGINAVRLKYNRDTSLVDVVRRLEKIPKSKELKKVDPKIRQDVVDLVDKLIKDDNPFMSVAEIAKEFKITGMDARRIINAAKLEKYFDLHNKYTDAKRKKLFAEVAELHKLDLTYEEIGKRLGISGDAVNHIVKKMKLPLRRPGGGGGLPGVIKRGGVMIPRSLAMKQNKEMLDLYQRGYSLTDIAKEMGIGVATVREIIKKFADNDKVRIRGNNVTEKENQIRKLLKEGLHPREIMRDIIGNVTYSRILEIAKEEDIKIPPMRKFKSDNQNFNSFENDDYFY
jgi:DNA-binding CsgD family transcriptional regulator